jgi:hypothetical protein
MPFEHPIVDEAELRDLYREPSALVLRKVIDRVDDAARAFVEASPFVVLATRGRRGADVSPRGGPPGFVRVLDEHRLAVGDLSGNNRLDSLANLLTDPAIALLFVVPGVGETLRVTGRGTPTRDPAVLTEVAVDRRRPAVAIGVDVDTCFIQCAKAFRRAGLWDPACWPAPEDRPSAASALVDHAGLDVAPAVVEARLEEGYRATLWEAGGR